MKKFVLILTATAMCGSLASAASIVGGTGGAATGTFTAPVVVNDNGTTFWGNKSFDTGAGPGQVGNGGNIGYYMVGGGLFDGTPAPAPDTPSSYYSNGGAATSFSFLKQASTLSITAMFAMANSNPFNTFGFYEIGNVINRQQIYAKGSLTASQQTPGATTAITPNWANFGVYVTVCFAGATVDGLPCAERTYLSGDNNSYNNLNQPTSSFQHFALFQVTQGATTQYYLGFDDGLTNTGLEGSGDFNDLIFRITAADGSGSGVPEPATVSMVGMALLALGYAGRKLRR